MIELNKVCLKYKNAKNFALEDLDITIKSGEFVYVIGPSGSGKSSILKLLINEIKPTSGNLNVSGYELNKLSKSKRQFYRRKLGIVFQDYKILENLNVYDNIAFALRVTGTKDNEVIGKKVKSILEIVRLSHKRDSNVSELSGGELQRIALARAMVTKPEILICDEPTGNLDPRKSKEIMEMLNMFNQQGTTIIMATHNNEIVNENRHRVISIDHGTIVNDQNEGTYNYHD